MNKDEYFVVMGKKNCSFCDKAVDMLESGEFDHTYIDVEQDNTALERLVSAGLKTVPQIYLCNRSSNKATHLGGCGDLENYLMNL